jgi:DNA-binding MarR family transcriptional regulator
MTADTRGATRKVGDAEIDAVLQACRSLVAIAAWSVDAVADEVDVVQLRILVVVATREWASLKTVVEATRLHPSRASRTCDRLVGKGLMTRTADPEDRRSVQLNLTAAGERIVRRVRRARRAAITPVLAGMSERSRVDLLRGLDEFAAASGGPRDADLSTMAWTE